MTNEEAIKQLESVTIYHDFKCTREALDIAICALKNSANLTDERDRFKKKYLESETDATNLTGELVTVSAENADLKQEVTYLHDVIADYDDCCRKRACPQMEKLKAQNEALKRILKSKIKVYAFPICTEEHDGCLCCQYQIESELCLPCKKCKGTAIALSKEYRTRKDYWRKQND